MGKGNIIFCDFPFCLFSLLYFFVFAFSAALPRFFTGSSSAHLFVFSVWTKGPALGCRTTPKWCGPPLPSLLLQWCSPLREPSLWPGPGGPAGWWGGAWIIIFFDFICLIYQFIIFIFCERLSLSFGVWNLFTEFPHIFTYPGSEN